MAIFTWPAGDLGDAVADSGGGLDWLGISELAFEAGDGDIDGASEGVGVLVPDLEQELFRGERAGARAQQGLEYRELFG